MVLRRASTENRDRTRTTLLRSVCVLSGTAACALLRILGCSPGFASASAAAVPCRSSLGIPIRVMTTPPLPPMLAVSLTLDDAGRAPGSTLSGAVTLCAPSRQTIRRLLMPHNAQQQQTHADNTQPADTDSIVEEEEDETDSDADADDGDGRSARPSSANGGSLETDTLLPSAASNGHASAGHPGSVPSPLAASSLLLAPLTRAFPIDLKLQLMGRCIYDNDRLYAPAMQRFAKAAAGAPNGQGGTKQTVFRMWSTRVAEVSVSADDCASGMPQTYSFHARLPSCLPPSFSGAALKHIYYLQLLGVAGGRKVLDVKLPFRVRVAAGGGSMAGSDRSHAHTMLATGRPQVVETPAGLVSSMQLSLTSPLPAFPAAAAAAAAEQQSASASSSSTAAASNLAAPSPLQSSIPPLQLRLSVETGETPGPQTALSSGGAVPAPLSFGMTHSGGGSTQLHSAAAGSSKHASSPAPAPSESDQLLPRTRRPSFPLSPLLDTPLTFNLSKTVLVRTPAAAPTPLSMRDRLTGSSPSPAAAAAVSPTEVSAHVVKLTLDNRYTRPGDTVRGHLDFSAATIRCYRVNINLEQVETVAEDVTRPEPNGSAAASPVSSSKVYWRWHAYTVNTLSTHFTFCLPLDVLPNFTTDLVSVSWCLRFQLITDVDSSPSHSWSFLPAPSATKAEPLKWVLPLMVLPNDEDASAQPVVKTVLCTPNSVV